MEAIVLDLDGTLLTSKKTISEKTKDVLHKLREKGVKIIIATGRTYVSLKPYRDLLGLDTPVVCFNGGKLVDGNENIVFEIPIKGDIALECIEIAKTLGIHTNYYQNEVWYIEEGQEDSEEVKVYQEISDLPFEVKKIEDFENYDMTKLLFVGENEVLKLLDKQLEERLGDKIHRAFSKKFFLEIMDKSVNKGETLLKLFEMEGINKDKVIAFGDGWNDLEMLQIVGEGVVMGNAEDELKTIIGNTCDTNDNDGIGKYLEKFLKD